MSAEDETPVAQSLERGSSPQLSDGTSEFFLGTAKYGWVHAFDDASGVRRHYWAVKEDLLPTSEIRFKFKARNSGYDSDFATFCSDATASLGATTVCTRYKQVTSG